VVREEPWTPDVISSKDVWSAAVSRCVSAPESARAAASTTRGGDPPSPLSPSGFSAERSTLYICSDLLDRSCEFMPPLVLGAAANYLLPQCK